MLTQGELAERAGLSLHTVHYAEHGRSISPKTGRALAEALGVEPRELLPKAQAPRKSGPPSEAEVITLNSHAVERALEQMTDEDRARAEHFLASVAEETQRLRRQDTEERRGRSA